MLGSYLKINDEVLPNPNPGTFSYKYNPDESIFTSEAGTQLSQIRRLDRLSWSGSFNCTSRLKEKLATYCKTPSVSCQLANGTAISGRLRLGGDISLVEDSEKVKGTNGLWIVPLTFEGE